MKVWEKPQYEDIRFGFEVTMYIWNRQYILFSLRKWACSGEGTHPLVYLSVEDRCPYCNSKYNDNERKESLEDELDDEE